MTGRRKGCTVCGDCDGYDCCWVSMDEIRVGLRPKLLAVLETIGRKDKRLRRLERWSSKVDPEERENAFLELRSRINRRIREAAEPSWSEPYQIRKASHPNGTAWYGLSLRPALIADLEGRPWRIWRLDRTQLRSLRP